MAVKTIMQVSSDFQRGEIRWLRKLSPGASKFFYPAWLYIITIMGAADQYLDSTVAAAAIACEWRLAWAIVVSFVISFFAQTLAACVGNKDISGAFYAAMGICPEGYLAGSEGSHHTYDERKGYQVAVYIARGITESIPQAYLQSAFVYEVFGSTFLAYLSICLSGFLGVKCMYVGFHHFYYGDE